MTDKILVRPFSASLLIALLIAFAGPAEVILANIDELAYGLSSHTRLAVFVFVVCAGSLGLLCIAAALLQRRSVEFIETVLIAACVLMLLNKTLLYGDYGAFDGRGLRIDLVSIRSALQLLLCVAVFTTLWRNRKLRGIALLMSWLYAAITLALAFWQFYHPGRELAALDKQPSPVDRSFFRFSKTAPNYLYIVLDEVYGGSARQVLEENRGLAESFDGFTFFNDTAAVYPTTIVSIPSILNGSLYHNKIPIADYFEESFTNSALFATLRRRDYPAYIHSSGMYCKHLDIESCSDMGDMLPGQKAADLEYGKTLDIALFKMAPDLMKPLVYNSGNWLLRQGLVKAGSAGRSSFQVQEFRYFIDQIDVAGKGSSFKLFHNTVTHSPVRHNADCELLAGNLDPLYDNYIEQDKCGFSLVERLLDRLRELQLYDNTYIVVSSDHGRPYIPEDYRDVFDSSPSGASYRQYGYAHATLLVKPLAARGELHFSETPASLLDIGYLLSDSINDPAAALAQRYNREERPFNYYNWSKKYFDWKQEYLPPLEAMYLIGEDITNPRSWRENTALTRQVMHRQLKEPLGCGRPVRFGIAGDQPLYSSSGLSTIESWGRWSDGSTTRIHFRGGPAACPEQRMHIDLRAYLRKNKPLQQAAVYLNGRMIGEVTFRLNDSKTKQLALPLDEGDYRPGDINTLELRISDPKSPAQLGDGNDPRKLALGLITLTVK